MMNLEVFDEGKAKAQTTYLTLNKTSDGNITVWVCDVDGNLRPGGCIAIFRKCGELYLDRGINPNLGFALDDKGCIKLGE